MRQNSYDNRGQPSPPPVNPSGLSGFKGTDGVVEEDENEYAQEDLPVEQF